MKNRKDQNIDRSVESRSIDLEREADWQPFQEPLHESLRAMVADESEHVREEFLTDNILRAVRVSSNQRSWFDELWTDVIRSQLRPLVVAGILLVFLLAAYNAQQVSSDLVDRSITERVFGLHPFTVASAYDLDLESITR